jgi:hypothetical protein
MLVEPKTGALRFIDFGLARRGYRRAPGGPTLLLDAVRRGEIAPVPEHRAEHSEGPLSSRVDDYALGVLVTQILCNREFLAEEFGSVALALRATGVPVACLRVLLAMMNKEPGSRPHAAELLDALTQWTDQYSGAFGQYAREHQCKVQDRCKEVEARFSGVDQRTVGQLMNTF